MSFHSMARSLRDDRHAWGIGAFPGSLGAAMAPLAYLRIDMDGWPRETEACLCVLLALLVWLLARTGLQFLFREETPQEVIDRLIGDGADFQARRRVKIILKARQHVRAIRTALQPRSAAVQDAARRLEAEMEALFEDILDSEDSLAAASTLLKRNLPRLSDAAQVYAKHARRADSLGDIEEMRRRIITALDTFSDQAIAARRRLLSSSETELGIALDVFDSSLAYLPGHPPDTSERTSS